MKRIHITILFIIFVLFATPVKAQTSKKLPVPFTPQAPTSDWNQPWQDACEESTISMIDHFYNNKKINSETAQKSIKEIIEIKNKFIGESLDENANTIVDLINGFLSWEAHTVVNPTLEQIKREIDNNRPVIMPLHGKYLYNPYFKNGGPDYHSIVISGYDDANQEFITQEPGTRRGLDFRYSYATIMNAMHDFVPGLQTKFGDKVAIFTSKNLSISSETDADNDGLKKIEEIQLQTFLHKSDSDDDGYVDGTEVKAGYSPIHPSIQDKKIPTGTLIKAVNDARVYLLQNGLKRHILNETVFINYGWSWLQILPVTSEFIDSLQTGDNIKE